MIHLALKTLMQLIAITKEYLFQDNMLSNIIQIQTQLKASIISYVILNQLLRYIFDLIHLFDFLAGAVDLIVFI